MAHTKYLEIHNNDSRLIIDDTFKNLRLSRIGKISEQHLLTDNSSGYELAYKIPTSGEIPAIYCANNFFDIHSFFTQETLFISFKATDGTFLGENAVRDSINATTIYFFTDEQDTKTNGAGLLIYNARGELVFNGNSKYARIVGAFLKYEVMPSESKTMWDGMPQTTFACERVAVIPFAMHEWVRVTPQISSTSDMRVRWHTANALSCSWKDNETGANPGNLPLDLTGIYMATCMLFINVTGYENGEETGDKEFTIIIADGRQITINKPKATKIEIRIGEIIKTLPIEYDGDEDFEKGEVTVSAVGYRRGGMPIINITINDEETILLSHGEAEPYFSKDGRCTAILKVKLLN